MDQRCYDAVVKHHTECRRRCMAVASDLKMQVDNLARDRRQQKEAHGHIDTDPELVLRVMRAYWGCEKLKVMRKALLDDYRQCIVDQKFKVINLSLSCSPQLCLCVCVCVCNKYYKFLLAG